MKKSDKIVLYTNLLAAQLESSFDIPRDDTKKMIYDSIEKRVDNSKKQLNDGK